MNAPENPIYEFGPFLLEPRARRLSRDGELVPLGGPEFELLVLLVRNRGRVVEKREIMEAVWPDVEVEENNLTVRMSALRKALGETKENHPYIQTVSGRGYCLIVAVKELPGEPITETAETVTNDQGQPELTEEQRLPFQSDVTDRSSDSFPLNASQRNRKIQRFPLYAIFAVALVLPLLLVVVLRRHKAGESEAPAQSMKISRVTQSGHVQSAALSPDGQNIAYVERDGELCSLWLQRAAPSNPLQLLPPSKSIYYSNPSFSRDGHTLYYSKCEQGCRLYKMPVLGGVETPLGVRADSRVAFSPDGKRMAYVRSEVDAQGLVVVKMFVANPDGTGEEALNWQGGGRTYQGGAPAWSPDGKVIAFSILVSEGGQKEMMKVIALGVTDHTESTLISHWLNIRDIAWLPDGSSLIINGRNVASADEPHMQIWRVPLSGGEPRRITNDLNNYATISLSVDGNTLIALHWQQTAGLSIAPSENPSAAVQVTTGTLDRQDGRLGLSATPDGRLVYVSNRSGKWDLWSINADGTGLKQLTDASHRDNAPVVSPDGRYIVFQTCRSDAISNRNIWRVDADGRNAIQLTRGTYDDEPTFSPDGQWVVYVSDEGRVPKLRRVPISGGDPTLLTDEFAQHPAFSPDGKVLVYYRMNQKQRDQRHFVFIPAGGGAPIKTIPAPNNFGSIMRWAPTGDSLWYRDSTLTSIWLLPLDGTPPTAVLKLRNQQLSNFSLSQDGRRLAYSSGSLLRDVVLITRFN